MNDPTFPSLPPHINRDHPILVVDDERSVREMIAFCLEEFGFQVHQAENVDRACYLLRNGPFSLIISDYQMPGGTGLDLLNYVTEVHPDLPFIMLTAHDEIPLARHVMKSGALDFLGKPFTVHQLERVIEQNWARLERDRERAFQFGQDVLKGTIKALVAAVDAKDPHTATHSERVTRLAVQLGETLGYHPDRIRQIEFAAMLHDVGKIGIPDYILTKPDKLNEEEYALVKLHPAASAEIVGKVGSLNEIVNIVRHHHERWDGLGYPDGLSGEAIPLYSRLISLADVYEALTSNRSYRPPMTPRAARELIQSGLGTQFDLSLGEAFLNQSELL